MWMGWKTRKYGKDRKYSRNLEFGEVRLQYYICAYNYNCQYINLYGNIKDFELLTLEEVELYHQFEEEQR